MSDGGATVFVVDDDPAVRKALQRLFRAAGLHVETFAEAQEFLTGSRPESPGCLVLDLRLPGISGLDLQEELAAAHLDLPIIFLTGYGTVPESVRAMKAGAVEFLEKPIDDQTLLAAVNQALSVNYQTRQEKSEMTAIERRLAALTPRERQVLALVATGKLNKEIAWDLGTTEKTIKVHRGRVMQKLNCGSLAELVRLAAKAGIYPPKK
jgi:FixJ family two-component response regulator